jgi:hypothetical protein
MLTQYQSKQCNIPEEFRLQQHRCGDVKSCIVWFCKKLWLTSLDISQNEMCYIFMIISMNLDTAVSSCDQKRKLTCRGISQIKIWKDNVKLEMRLLKYSILGTRKKCLKIVPLLILRISVWIGKLVTWI